MLLERPTSPRDSVRFFPPHAVSKKAISRQTDRLFCSTGYSFFTNYTYVGWQHYTELDYYIQMNSPTGEILEIVSYDVTRCYIYVCHFIYSSIGIICLLLWLDDFAYSIVIYYLSERTVLCTASTTYNTCTY